MAGVVGCESIDEFLSVVVWRNTIDDNLSHPQRRIQVSAAVDILFYTVLRPVVGLGLG